MEPKRILHVTSVLNYGGIENLIMDIFRRIDREKIIFDFLVIREDIGIHEEEIRSLGGKIFKVPSMKKVGYFKFKRNIDNFFKSNNNYTHVHSHVNTWSGLILDAAKKYNIPIRISHSHTSNPKYPFPTSIIKNHWKKKIPKVSTHLFACSTAAAGWLFGEQSKDAIILKNGIDTQRFIFSEEKRKFFRKALNVEKKFILISVGRLSKEKNTAFLIKVIAELKKNNPDILWICVGEGKERKKIDVLSRKYGIKNNVLFLGAQKEVENYLNCADVYISSSLYEGFGTSVLEAQCNSLKCVISDAFPREVDFSDNCTFLSLKTPIHIWAEKILKSERCTDSDKISQKLQLSGVDINFSVDFLCDFYLIK